MIRSSTLSIAAFSLLAASAHADVTVGEYKAVLKTGHIPPVVRGYVRGIIEGITTASAFQQVDHKPPLFCTAKDFQSSFDSYAKIIDAYVAIDHPKDNEPLSITIYSALVKYLKCEDEAPGKP
jgi:hypothetical protein